MSKNKKIEIVIILLLPIIGTIISLVFSTNFFVSIILFFALPSIYLSFKISSHIKKAIIFAVLFGIGIIFFADYLAMIDGAWFIPSTIFPFRIFGIVPIEDFVLAFFFVYYLVIFYEYFFDKHREYFLLNLKKKRVELMNKRMKYFLAPLIFILLIFLIIYYFNPQLLIIRYSYLWLGIFFTIIPISIFIFLFPRLLPKYFKVALYFFYVLSLFEFVGLRLNQWEFPGQHFIGYLEIFKCRFPIEEFVFWISLSSTSILSFYEFFDDDRK